MALARGHRWLAILESGAVKSLTEIAGKEGVDSSYVSRMVNLTTLAPDIVTAILDETLRPDVTRFALAVDPPALWEEQGWRIGMASSVCGAAIIDHHKTVHPLLFARSRETTKLLWGKEEFLL